MMFTSVRELKAKTSEVLRQVNKEDEPAIITSHGKPQAILMPADEEELEDLFYQYSPKFKKMMEEAEEDIKAGKFIAWDDYIEKRRKKQKK